MKKASAPSLAGTANSASISVMDSTDRPRWASALPETTSSSTVSRKTGTTMPSQPVAVKARLKVTWKGGR
ncbi:hypothetical protein X770_25475 [Mesorhizobium sp. LSJC269B00]|nr:hypothetical protein X770_25475 [Mesorhizobium sp. LSJC269B00]